LDEPVKNVKKSPKTAVLGDFLYKESFRFTQFRRSGLPPSDEGGGKNLFDF
jgi:hypothetical protein